jgi:hypothetical protein
MLEKTPFPYGAGFRSLDRKTLDPVRLSVRAELPASPDRFGLHQPSASLTWPAPWRMDFREIQGSSVRRAAALNIVDLLRYRPLATERNK